MSEEIIDYELFSKLDLRVARVIKAEKIEGSRKLLRLLVDVGPLGERQLIAGIGEAYLPEDLVGKQIIILANLKPKKIMGNVSQGMLLATGCDKNGKPVLLVPEREVENGSKVC